MCAVGTNFEFFQISLFVHVDCSHPRRVSRFFFLVVRSVLLFLLVFEFMFPYCSTNFARQFQRWWVFQEPIVTPDGLGTVGMFTFVSCLSGHALSLHSYRPGCSGLFRLMSSPCLFLLQRLC